MGAWRLVGVAGERGELVMVIARVALTTLCCVPHRMRDLPQDIVGVVTAEDRPPLDK